MANKNFEILAPGGDRDSILAAIAAGADAIYCGLDKFNARNRATNISLDDLNELLPIAHAQGTKIFLTLNIMFLESEFPTLLRLLNQLSQTSLDGVIVQDLGLAYVIKHHFPHFAMHASTQMNSLNIGQIDALAQLSFERLNLARELSAKEIKSLATYARAKGMDTEIFVHGSYCISFSGLCYASSVRNGASGNRGRCSQPCRDSYTQTDLGVTHPLNMKDNSAFLHTADLKDSGAYSFKIEGRIKGAHYVYHAVKTWREQLEKSEKNGEVSSDLKPLHQVFNRDFSAGYLKNSINQDMYIDNPRDYSADYLVKRDNIILSDAKQKVYDQKTQIIQEVNAAVAHLLDSQLAIDEPQSPIKRKYVEPSKHKDSGVSEDVKRDKPSTAILIDNIKCLDVDFTEKYPQLASIWQQIDTNRQDVFYQMPAHFKGLQFQLVDLFTNNLALIPYFPAVLIGDDFTQACEFLSQVKPKLIVSNNLGLGYYAAKHGVEWIAGPELNIANRYALKCLQEEFAASGAFISDELSRVQVRKIAAPDNFKLYYNLYHPITAMISRQCFFLQATGCHKNRRKVTRACLADCEQFSELHNNNGENYLIDKRKGQYNKLIYNKACLNNKILLDLPQFFSHIMLDLTSINDRLEMLTNQQYEKGV